MGMPPWVSLTPKGIQWEESAPGPPPFSPLDLSPALWLDAGEGAYTDAGTTLATNGQAVQQWNDQSGNNRHASEATNKPTFVNSGSYPAVRFDGTNDKLNGTYSITNTPYTFFAVVKTATPAQAQFSGIFASTSISATTKSFQIEFSGSSTYRLAAEGNAAADQTAIIGAADTNASILTLVGNASGISTYKNGVAGGTTTDPTNGSFGTYGIGRNRGSTVFAAIDVEEVIIYPTELSSGERQTVLEYLADKHSITLP